MSFSSKVLYTGDNVLTQFNVPFSFISPSHVKVYVNEVLMLIPMNYTLVGSTVTFFEAPAVDAAIEIKRDTSPTDLLVDFQDGSVLNESDLDTAYQHSFFLYQEATDSFNELVQEAITAIATGTGITETDTSEIISALVTQMLDTDAAATLQQRVDDIDTNAESILQLGTDLQVQINTLAGGVAAVIYIQDAEPVPGVGGIPDPIVEGARWYDTDDNNAAYIYTSGAWLSINDPRIGQAVADISVLQTSVADNAAAIITEAAARSNADIATASTLALIGAQNGAQTAFVVDTSTVKIDSDSGDTFAAKFTQLDATDGVNAAAIATEATARTTGDSANATLITALDVRVTDAETDITTNAASVLTEQTARIAGDSANASSITAVQADVDNHNRIFYQGTAPTADKTGDLWIDTDDNQLYRWNGTGWDAIQDTAIAGNASAITSLSSTVVGYGDSINDNTVGVAANASLITTLSASISTVSGDVATANVNIGANATAISNSAGDITTLEAKYGVQLDVNGYITGFAQNNDGTTGNFVIMADNFAIQEPGESAGAGIIPFSVSGGVVSMQNVVVNGSLLVNGTVIGDHIADDTITADLIATGTITADEIAAGTITADEITVTTLSALTADLGSMTAGDITLDALGFIKGGQTAYGTGTGFFLGYSGGDYKFSVGDGTNFLRWDGTSLIVRGNLSVGQYDASDNIMISATTERTSSSTSWVEIKKFEINRPGTLRCEADIKMNSVVGGVALAGSMRWVLDGVVQNTVTTSSSSYATDSYDMTVGAEAQYVTLEYRSGLRSISEPVETGTLIRNVYIKADKSDGESTITD